MKPNGKRLVVLAIVAVIGFSSLMYLFTAAPSRERQPLVPLSPHKSISIGGDRDFTLVGAGFGCECVRSGEGSKKYPYLITSWTINASDVDGISIFGTKTNFLIKGVRINGTPAHIGIKLVNVEIGKIENSFITNALYAVYVFRSTNLVFLNNTFVANQFGIRIEASDNNILSSNHFREIAEVGVFVRGSANLIKDNEVLNSEFGGINIDGTSGMADGNRIEHNIVKDNGSYGIALWRATNCTLRANTVSRNGVGIMLTADSSGNTIEENIVTQNIGDGISLTGGSSNNTVIGNIAKGNGDGVNSFDLHELGSNNTWQDNTYITKKPDTLS